MDVTKRTPIIAGNWKMNLNRSQAGELVTALCPLVADARCEVVLCVPFTDLETVSQTLRGSRIRLGAQNCHWAKSGAFTGEISASMLADAGAAYVIIGHSERRQYFGETDQTVNSRLKAALAEGLSVILCVGETLEQREGDCTTEVIHRQLIGALDGVDAAAAGRIVFAYEPIWAIGTGKTATADQAGEVCAFIRGTLVGLYSQEMAFAARVQYGGSMNPKNAAELLTQYDIDGGLIGGASLQAADFAEIVRAASKQ